MPYSELNKNCTKNSFKKNNKKSQVEQKSFWTGDYCTGENRSEGEVTRNLNKIFIRDVDFLFLKV